MRIVLLVLLMCTAAPVWAKWVRVAEGGSAVYYVDPASIRKEGDLRRVWALQERKRPGTGGEMSRKTQFEFDCKNQTLRVRNASSYTGGMGGGEVLNSGRGTDKPRAIETEGVEQQVFKYACSQ